MQTTHPLDNLVWQAMNTEHAHLASGTALAKRYPRDIFPAVALADHSEAAFHELSELVPKGETVALIEAQPPTEIPGWTIQQQYEVIQMICQQPAAEKLPVAEKPPAPEIENPVPFVRLTDSDVPDMLALIDLAKPGPFFPRTIEMGRYFGIHQDGQLVAMAGERIRPSGYCEISAVCTHPAYVGRGYARQLVSFLVNDHFKQGITPILHVRGGNTRAYGLYERLNFRPRCDISLVLMNH